MVNSPKILLADEPTGNLDPVTAQEIIDLLFRINDGGTCVVFSTHDHEIVKTFGQRVMVIQDGRIVSDEKRRVAVDRTRQPGRQDVPARRPTGRPPRRCRPCLDAPSSRYLCGSPSPASTGGN